MIEKFITAPQMKDVIPNRCGNFCPLGRRGGQFIPETLAKYPSLRSLAMISDFAPYIFIIIVSLAIGWMIISSIASLLYAMSEPKYGASTAAAIRSLVKILGLGGLFASVGGIAGGAAGVALGGFIGLVVGFATQQVLGQAIAGLFILLARPFKIGDNVDIAGESDVIIKDIGTLFTLVERKSDSNTVLIPSTMIIGQKIVIRRKSQ